MSWFSLFPLPNEVFLFLISLVLLCLLVEDLFATTETAEEGKSRTHTHTHSQSLPARCRVQLAPPVYFGAVSDRVVHPSFSSLCGLVPRNVRTLSLRELERERTINVVRSPRRLSQRPLPFTPSLDNNNNSNNNNNNKSLSLSVAAMDAATLSVTTTNRQSLSQSLTAGRASLTVVSVAEIEICKKIAFPFMPGCDPSGPEVAAMMKRFPVLSRPDAVRFLVARKGDVQAAQEMAEKCLAWRSRVFPLKKADVQAAFNTFCFFPYGVSKDGSPVVYMRGALYDNTKATPEQYCLAAAYTIDWSLKQHPDQTNVTVLVHAGFVEGGANQSADTNFIKLFIQVLSDNYPERLKRLAIFPFPWYGRAIWGMLKVFVDKRTQDKVMLLSHSGNSVPRELLEFMDPSEIPSFCGGTCTRPVPNLLDTIED